MNFRHPLRSLLPLALLLGAGLGHSQELKTRERYRLHPGDTLTMEYRLTPDLNELIIIQPDGYISTKLGKDVHVGGLTLAEAKKAILDADSAELNEPELTLTLKEFARPTVLVAGEVEKPGPIELRENQTVISAILMAGGYKDDAKKGDVILFRRVDGSIVETYKLHLANLASAARHEKDMTLEPGDMILVPHDLPSRLDHYMKSANLGLYFNPFQLP